MPQRNSKLRLKRVELQFILLAILLFINLIFNFFPLVNIIGYESSVLNSFLFFIFSGYLSILYTRKESSASFTGYFSRHKTFFILALLIPFVTGISSTLVFTNCPVIDGILFYLVISMPSLFFGSVSGILIVKYARRYHKLIFHFLTILILIIPLIEIYFNPQIFFYNLIIGFFPGTIYDEDLAVDSKLILFRMLLIILFIIFLGIHFLYTKKKLNRLQSISLILVISSVFILIKPCLSFSTDIGTIARHLNNRIETPRFQILYSDSIDSIKAEQIALLHEYYYEQISGKLNIRREKKITSFIFNDREDKRNYFGAGNANVAKPWLNQIYLNGNEFDASLKHELVHILAGDFGTTPFKVADNLNPAMIEGFAMAIEDDFNGLSVHSIARMARKSGFKISIADLFDGLDFFSHFSSLAYIYSGSFVKYLIETYGIEKVKALYSNLEFENILGDSLYNLEQNFYRFLDAEEITFTKHLAQLYLGGKSIFKKHCARAAAKRIKDAWILFDDKKYNEGVINFREVYFYSGSYQALNGWLNSLTQLKKFKEAEEILLKELNYFVQTPYLYILELMAGDLSVRNNKPEEGLKYYDSLVVQSPSIEYRNEASLRLRIGEYSRDSLKKYIEADIVERFNILKSININAILYESIPSLIRYAEVDKIKWKFLKELSGRLKVNDRVSAFSVLGLSKMALKNGDYLLAKELAVKSLEFDSGDIHNKIFIDNLRMINWFYNFAEEVKKNFHYQ